MTDLPQTVSGVSAMNGGPLDGTVHRRGRGPGQAVPLDYHVKVDPRVWAEAQRILRPGERILIKSPTEVWLVNNTEKREKR